MRSCAGVGKATAFPVERCYRYRMDPAIGHNRAEEPFREQFVIFLKEVIQAFATATPGYAHDKRSRWAYAFNPMPDGDAEKPVYATMAALRAPNFAALRVGVTED